MQLHSGTLKVISCITIIRHNLKFFKMFIIGWQYFDITSSFPKEHAILVFVMKTLKLVKPVVGVRPNFAVTKIEI